MNNERTLSWREQEEAQLQPDLTPRTVQEILAYV